MFEATFKSAKVQINFIKSFYKHTTFLGLTPCYDFEENQLVHHKLNKLYISIFSTFNAVLYIYFVYGYLNYIKLEVNEAAITIDCLLYLFKTLTVIYCLISSNFKNRQNWSEFLKSLQLINKKLNKNEIREKEKKNWISIIENVLLFLFLFAEFTLHSFVFNFNTSKYYLLSRYQIYMIFAMSSLTCNFATCLKNFTQGLNRTLKRQERWKKLYKIDVEGLLRLYEDISNAHDIFNEIFGWEILLFIITVTLKILEAINFIRFMEKMPELGEFLSKAIIIFGFLKTLLFVVSMCLLSK